MSTLDQRFNATPNRLIGTDDLGLRGLDYVRGLVLEGIEQTFRKDAVFGSVKLGLSADGTDKFKVDGTAIATDGSGHMLDIANSGFSTGIQFENLTGQDYDIGLGFAEVPAGIQIGGRSGNPEYVAFEEQVGKSADPDSVVDNGGVTITFVVDSVTEVGVTNAGRKVRVFKKVPGKTATTEAIAVEELTVAFVGGKNQVTTVDTLGQATISTVAADYTVVLMGPIVKRDSGLISAPGVVFLGVIDGKTGVPPDTFNLGGQEIFDFSFADLDDFTRRDGGSDLLKIDVKADALDVTTSQIQVQDPATAVVWSVDGNGKMFTTSVSSDLFPSLDVTKDIGSLTKRWREGFFDKLDIKTRVTPTTNDTGSIGTSSLLWKDIFATQLSLGPSPLGLLSGNFVDAGDNALLSSVNAIGINLNLDGAPSAAASTNWKGVSISLEPNPSSGMMPLLVGFDSLVQANGTGASEITDVIGLRVRGGLIGGTITVENHLGIEINSPSSSGVLANAFGLVVRDINVGGGAVNKAIQTGLGLVEFGDNVIPSADGSHKLGTNAVKWGEIHGRRLGIGNGSGITFPDDDSLVKFENLGVTVTDVARVLEIDLSNAVGATPAPGFMVALDVKTESKHTSGPAIVNQAAVFNATHSGIGATVGSLIGAGGVTEVSDGTVTSAAALVASNPIVSGGGVITTAHGLLVASITAGGTNFAIKTGLGLVEFGDNVSVLGSLIGNAGTLEVGDDLHPNAAGVDIGGVAAADRWQDIYCEKIRANDMPLGQASADTTTTQSFPTTWANVAVFQQLFVSGGMAFSGGAIWTVPANGGGTYRVSYNIPFLDANPPPTTTPSRVMARCQINGSTDVIQSNSHISITDSNDRGTLTASFLVELAAGDTIALQIVHTDLESESVTILNPANYPSHLDADNFDAIGGYGINAVSLTG